MYFSLSPDVRRYFCGMRRPGQEAAYPAPTDPAPSDPVQTHRTQLELKYGMKLKSILGAAIIVSVTGCGTVRNTVRDIWPSPRPPAPVDIEAERARERADVLREREEARTRLLATPANARPGGSAAVTFKTRAIKDRKLRVVVS